MEKIGDIIKRSSTPTLIASDTERKPTQVAGELDSLQMERGVVVPSKDDKYRNAECLTCCDAGWVYHDLSSSDHPDFGKVYPCPDCTRATGGEDKTTMMLRYSGIPDARREYNLVSFLPLAGTKEAQDAAWAMSDGTTNLKWLLLYGKCGNGKTHLVIAAGIEMVKRGIVVKFIKVADMLSEFRRAMSSGEISCDELVQRYKDVECLILDDIGVEQETEWSISKLEEIITSRYENKKYLLATTNEDIDDLSDRIRSRFLDPDLSVAVRNLASDYRKRKK